MSANNDYYKILGVGKTATADEIKKAYRKLAIKYHPDKTKGDKALEEKFKEISEAYAVLSNPEKRKEFDQFGQAGFHRRYSQEDIFRGADFNDMFRDFGFGGDDFISRIFGFGGRSSRQGFDYSGHFGDFGQTSTLANKGRDILYELPVSLSDVYHGATKIIALPKKTGESERISIKIPKGIESEKKLRIPGKGEPGLSGGAPGDLLIKIKIVPDSKFRRKGDDLEIEWPIKLTQALLGDTINVTALSGKSLSVKVPPGTQSGQKLKLKGQGMPKTKEGYGDLYVISKVQLPKKLSENQLKLIKSLAKEGL